MATPKGNEKKPAVVARLEKTKELQGFKRKITTAEKKADGLMVNHENIAMVSEQRQKLKTLRKEIWAERQKIVKPLDEAHKAASAFFKDYLLAPIDKTLEFYDDGIGQFEIAEQARREEINRKLMAQAAEKERKTKERLEKRAKDLEAQGRTEEAEMKQEEAEMYVAPVTKLEATGTKVKTAAGTTSARVYNAVTFWEVKAVCAAIAAGELPGIVVSVSQAALQRFADGKALEPGYHEKYGIRIEKRAKVTGQGARLK